LYSASFYKKRKEVDIKKEVHLNVNGRIVKFIEYEPTAEGDFVKVCTNEHRLGVEAEYVWILEKYGKYKFIQQKFSSLIINGKAVKCDLIIVRLSNKEIKHIYFDVSMMMNNLNYMTQGRTNKKLWDKKAKIIYDKLIKEYNFAVFNNDEESLYKKINEIVSIGFDVTFFFGFILNDKEERKAVTKEKIKCISILRKYKKNNFIANITGEKRIIGGYIRIDEIDDIGLVFENFVKLEKEYLEKV